MKKLDLEDWQVYNPDNRQDHLPQPYKLINQVLSQTIMYQLSLKLFEVQEKRKDKNYEGSIKQYYSQNTLEPDNISTLSSYCNTHNHLLAGDKAGNLYLLDLAKKTVFHKKQLFPSRRVIHITQYYLTDGDASFTTAAVILNAHNKIYIVRYRHDQPKLIVTHQIKVAANCDDPGKLPYHCQFQDYSRILYVYTYNGSILGYRISQIPIDLDAIQRGQTIPFEEEELKKKLRYPLNYATIETQSITINQLLFQIKFPGKKKPLTEQQILLKLNKKAEVAVPEVQVKKDPKKKQQKKQDKKEVQNEAPSQEFLMNQPQTVNAIDIEHGNDNTKSYSKPHFSPFLYVIHSRIQLQKKKSFEKGRYVDICQKIFYGWTNTRLFYFAAFMPKRSNYLSNFIYIQHFQQKITEQFAKQKQQILNQKIVFNNPKAVKNVSDITATSLSQNDQYFAAGLRNGSTTVWTTNSLNILLNTTKQHGAISQVVFFQKWKVISGTSKGQVQIDNLLTLSNQVKRTIIFQSKVDFAIVSIKISQLGICMVLDSNSNLRVFDLWRNQKIAKLYSCNSFSTQQSKAKRWISSKNQTTQLSIYTNNDFTVLLSTNWPNYSPREIQDSSQKAAEIAKLIQNPWKCSGTNVHVVRNFQFLINMFQGLETIYKKGYDRKKVQNLFSNLQFTQLYDRNFDIPDFGVTNQIKKTQKGTERGFGSRTKTFVSSKQKQKLMKDTSSLSSNVKPDLTNVVLHPQKFLLQRRKIGGNQITTTESLQNKIREGFKRQGALQNKLVNDISKGLV